MTKFEIDTKSEVSVVLKIVGGFLLLCLAAGIIVRMGSLGACGVLDRTLDADNIIFNYEMFHDVSEAHKAKLADIATHNELVATAKAEGDKEELRRLRMEFAALRSSCRRMASEYNADSEKINRTIFKSNNLPHSLAISDCE